MTNKTTHNRTRLGYIEGWLAIAGNIGLFVLKYWAGAVTGSIALMADAWHTLSDSFSSVIVLASMKISKKPADREHPFGHGRAELIASMIIGLFLGVIAFNFVMESIEKLKTHETVNFGTIALVAVITSIAVKEGLAQYAFWAGRKTGSNTLKADGWHHRTDAISSILILAGIFVGKYFWWIDGVLGIIVAGMIAWAAYEVMREAIDPLMGEKPEENLKNRLHQLSRQALGFDPEIHHIHLHRYGEHVELTFHITLPPDISLREAHSHIEKLENAIHENLEMTATIHADPAGMPEQD
ncbi:MAG: cation diffusion facilitator family transporter [Bacteroidota bacterium]